MRKTLYIYEVIGGEGAACYWNPCGVWLLIQLAIRIDLIANIVTVNFN